ncbi:MAG: hypothetical protein AAF086_07740 [Planctomycetota bacterium]
MKSWFYGFCFLFLLSLGHVGCSAVPEEKLIVPGKRIGPYILGQSTLQSIMGEDTVDNRRRFSEQGVMFEFDRGRELTGVLVTVSDFATSEGLSVGSSVDDAEAIFGSPISREVQGNLLRFDALIYGGIQFLFDENQITAIRVGAGKG